jgi:hypothetical protein
METFEQVITRTADEYRRNPGTHSFEAYHDRLTAEFEDKVVRGYGGGMLNNDEKARLAQASAELRAGLIRGRNQDGTLVGGLNADGTLATPARNADGTLVAPARNPDGTLVSPKP